MNLRETRSFAWPLVVTAALAISWWSLYTLAHAMFGMPIFLAAFVSAVFDGGALVLAQLERRYAESQDSGLAVRLMFLALVGASAWLNWEHAALAHYATAGRILFSAPSVIAGLLFVIEDRFIHRETLRLNGRVAPALPVFGRWAWLLHPARTAKRVWLITGNRIESIPLDAMNLVVETPPEPVAEITDWDRLVMDAPPPWNTMHKSDAVRRVYEVLPHVEDAAYDGLVAEWLQRLGIDITTNYIRTIRSRKNKIAA